MRQRVCAEIVGEVRGGVADVLQGGVFAVEHAQGVGVHAAAAVVVQRVFVRLQVGHQRGAVGGALFPVAQAVDFQRQLAGYAEFAPQVGAHGDHFGIDVGPSKPKASTPTWWNWR